MQSICHSVLSLSLCFSLSLHRFSSPSLFMQQSLAAALSLTPSPPPSLEDTLLLSPSSSLLLRFSISASLSGAKLQAKAQIRVIRMRLAPVGATVDASRGCQNRARDFNLDVHVCTRD